MEGRGMETKPVFRHNLPRPVSSIGRSQNGFMFSKYERIKCISMIVQLFASKYLSKQWPRWVWPPNTRVSPREVTDDSGSWLKSPASTTNASSERERMSSSEDSSATSSSFTGYNDLGGWSIAPTKTVLLFDLNVTHNSSMTSEYNPGWINKWPWRSSLMKIATPPPRLFLRSRRRSVYPGMFTIASWWWAFLSD